MPEPKLERQQSVLNLLQQLQGLEPLKKLFWSELNYDRVNQSLSRRGWKEGISGLLADDPVLFASGADAFHVIYARLASDKLLIGNERPVVSRLLQEHPYALFVFSNSRQEHFHFLNVKYDDDAQKRRLFRRITVGPFEQLRTASERITLLDLADVSPDLFGLSPLAIQERHDIAFDVEPVTKEFFTEYRRIFEEVEEAITGFGRDKERKRLYTQRLFNRMMFIAFIQKKGWLKFNGDADYLAALWKAHLKDNSISDKNFYRDRLKLLFFSALNNPSEVNITDINRGGGLKSIIGEVPYLNGGLFEEEDEDKDENIKMPDKATGAILNSLFAKFNFTVTESTPLDVEVAVDPEMLGRIFEELVTGRHETGSYYTPKPIVSFMCREALKGYLETNAAGESKGAIERFVEKHEPDDLRNAESVLDTLRRVKVCDPACGSGAYLLGMLHELLDLRAALFQTRKLDSPSVYQRKLEIIQTNVYGVDIDPFAVNIARLRLWLSLAVDFEGAKPEPLPNLDYKVEVGDSLLGPNPSGGLEMGFRKPLIDEFMSMKSAYLRAHHEEKRQLKGQIEKIRADITSFTGHEKVLGFDWAVEFAEVFVNGGFDIAIANPPYRKERESKELIAELQKNPRWKRWYEGKSDLWYLFLHQAIDICKEHGLIHFITSRYWIAGQGAKKLIERIHDETCVRILCDLSKVKVFDEVSGQHMTAMYEKGHRHKPLTIKRVITEDRASAMNSILAQESSDEVLVLRYSDDELLFRMKGRLDITPDLGEEGGIDAYRNGVVPLSIHFEVRQGIAQNPDRISQRVAKEFDGKYEKGEGVFVLSPDELKQLRLTKGEMGYIRPFFEDYQIHRFACDPTNEFWLLYLTTQNVKTLASLPNLHRHLSRFRPIMERRRETENGSNKWFHLHWPREERLFEGAKIIAVQMGARPTFGFSDSGCYVGFGCNLIKTELSEDALYALLGILNSTPAAQWFAKHAKQRGAGLDIGGTVLREFPIPENIISNGREIVPLARIIHERVRNNKNISPELEKKLDDAVTRAYEAASSSRVTRKS